MTDAELIAQIQEENANLHLAISATAKAARNEAEATASNDLGKLEAWWQLRIYRAETAKLEAETKASAMNAAAKRFFVEAKDDHHSAMFAYIMNRYTFGPEKEP